MGNTQQRSFADDEYCPICGQGDRKLKEGKHRCAPGTLSAIDGSHGRDPDTEDPRHEPEAQRLVDGIKMWKAAEEGTEL